MKKTVDIVVMGSGAAGLAAAIAAMDSGASVAVFEKRPFQGGSVSNCPIAFTRIRNERAYKDAAFKILYDFTNYNANPSVIRAYVDNCWRVYDLISERLKVETIPMMMLDLENLGNPALADGFPPSTLHGDSFIAKGRGKGHGFALVCLKGAQYIRDHGGEVVLDTPVTDILTDDEGKVCGVTAVNNTTGERWEVECKAVIVASGGIMDDPVMMKEYTGFTYTDDNCSGDGNVLFNCFPYSKQTGDGHKLTWKLGGAKSAIAVTGHNLVPGPGIVAWSPWIQFNNNQTRIIQEQPYLWVNKNGERFVDEGVVNNHMAISTAISNQPGRVSYIIIDEDTRLHLENEGVDFQYFIFPAERLTDIPGQFEHMINVDHNKHAFMVDTIEELCAQTGIDEVGLKATLERYNQYCEEGQDREFSKNPKYLRPVKRGKFYALRVFCAGYDTIGGIKVNGKMEVITDDGKPIPGLYAAGDIMTSELYGNPPVGGCSAVATAMSFGLASGDNAGMYVKK